MLPLMGSMAARFVSSHKWERRYLPAMDLKAMDLMAMGDASDE